MIEVVRQLLPTVLTMAAVNAQVVALNSRCGVSAPQLTGTDGVQNMWAKNFKALPAPGVGYMVGVLPGKQPTAELKSSGKNRTFNVPLWLEFQSAQCPDADTALMQVSLYERAVLYVLENLEGLATSWTPQPAGVVLIEPVTFEVLNFDATAAGKMLGFRARYDLVIDDLRS